MEVFKQYDDLIPQPAGPDTEDTQNIHDNGIIRRCNEELADMNANCTLVPIEITNCDNTGKETLSGSKYVCPYCKLQLASRQSLHRHKKSKHANEKMGEPTRATIQCFKCKLFCCGSMKELIGHLNSSHNLAIQIHQAAFRSDGEFHEWKSNLEKSCGTYFVRPNGSKYWRDHVTSYYYCNRSGMYETKRTGKRAIKSQGSSKISAHCSTFMKSITCRYTGKVNVEYSVYHLHDSKIGHQKMSKDLRSFIVGKLLNGVDSKVLLNELRNDLSKLDGRDKLVTHKDILNIKKQYNISMTNRGSNDSRSKKNERNGLHDYEPIVILQEQDVQQT